MFLNQFELQARIYQSDFNTKQIDECEKVINELNNLNDYNKILMHVINKYGETKTYEDGFEMKLLKAELELPFDNKKVVINHNSEKISISCYENTQKYYSKEWNKQN